MEADKEGDAPEAKDDTEKAATNGETKEEAKKDGDEPMPDAKEATEEKGEDAKGEDAKPQAEPAADPEAKRPKKKRKKEPEIRYEWVDVVKKKRRTKRTDLDITASGLPGLSDVKLQQRMDEETAMQAEMREIIETDEKRNDLESYILQIRDKVTESGQYGAFLSAADREKFSSELTKAEDWLYDHFDATKIEYIEKLSELSHTGDVVVWRFKEDGMRKDWINAVSGTVENYRNAAKSPGDKYGHIAAEKLGKIVSSCDELEKWLKELQAKQDALPKYEKPVLICAEMEKRNQELARMADDILKEPKPIAPKAPKECQAVHQEEKEEDQPMDQEEKEEDAADAKEAEPEAPPVKRNEMDVD